MGELRTELPPALRARDHGRGREMSELESVGGLRHWLTKAENVNEDGDWFSVSTTVAELDERLTAVMDEIAERFVELPADADGEPIHVGDTLHHDGDEFLAKGIALYHNTWRVICDEDEYAPGGFKMRLASKCRHVKPPAPESLLDGYFKARLQLEETSISDYDPAIEAITGYYADKLEAWKAGEAS